MNQVKVSIKAKNIFSKKKLLHRTPNPYGDTDDMPFCNNLKLSIFHSILEILYLFVCKNCPKKYFQTKQMIELYAFYSMKYQQTFTRKSSYSKHLNRFLRSFNLNSITNTTSASRMLSNGCEGRLFVLNLAFRGQYSSLMFSHFPTTHIPQHPDLM